MRSTGRIMGLEPETAAAISTGAAYVSGAAFTAAAVIAYPPSITVLLPTATAVAGEKTESSD